MVDRRLHIRAGSWFALKVINPVDKRLMRWPTNALYSGYTGYQGRPSRHISVMIPTPAN